jgi:hypothetical protein
MSIEEDEKEIEREVNAKQKCPNCGHRRIEFIGDRYVCDHCGCRDFLYNLSHYLF